jgi:hypothetical protein
MKIIECDNINIFTVREAKSTGIFINEFSECIHYLVNGNYHNPYGLAFIVSDGDHSYDIDGRELVHNDDDINRDEDKYKILLEKLRNSPNYEKI